MYFDFTDEKYKQFALSRKNVNYENSITAKDAFVILLKDLDYESMDNLCIEVSKKTLIDPKQIYEIVQSGQCDDNFKYVLLKTAYELIHSNRRVGTKAKENGRSLTSWISHCLFEGEVASQLAESMGLNPDTAMKLGIIHDVGRKIIQGFQHTILGFEYLVDNGLKDESFGTLTHPFLTEEVNRTLKGNRNAMCDFPTEGFYIDKDGKGIITDGYKKDDMTQFLENYEYNAYDIIINISDLMAMSSNITSPYERLQDVYSRRKPDSRNSSFFKVCFINTMNRIMYAIKKDNDYFTLLNINDIKSEKELNDLLIKTSNDFMETYNRIVNHEDSMKL